MKLGQFRKPKKYKTKKEKGYKISEEIAKQLKRVEALLKDQAPSK